MSENDPENTQLFLAGVLEVRFKPGSSDEDIKELIESMGLVLLEDTTPEGVRYTKWTVSVPEGKENDTVLLLRNKKLVMTAGLIYNIPCTQQS